MSTRALALLLTTSFVLTACSNEISSPSDAFLIPESQLAGVTNAANADDLEAVKRLISHYEATTGNEEVAEKWREKARSLGDAHELFNHAGSLLIRAKRESDPEKRRGILVEALNSAKRSHTNRADASTQRLVDEINRSLHSK